MEFSNKPVLAYAKVKCFAIEESQGSKWIKGDDVTPSKWEMTPKKKFKFQIVSPTTEENALFSAISGGTNVELVTINEGIFDKFKVGGEYYLPFYAAE